MLPGSSWMFSHVCWLEWSLFRCTILFLLPHSCGSAVEIWWTFIIQSITAVDRVAATTLCAFHFLSCAALLTVMDSLGLSSRKDVPWKGTWYSIISLSPCCWKLLQLVLRPSITVIVSVMSKPWAFHGCKSLTLGYLLWANLSFSMLKVAHTLVHMISEALEFFKEFFKASGESLWFIALLPLKLQPESIACALGFVQWLTFSVRRVR